MRKAWCGSGLKARDFSTENKKSPDGAGDFDSNSNWDQSSLGALSSSSIERS